MSRIKININGYELSGNEGDTILSVAKAAGIEIPTLCHDDKLDTYGACGICVVEAQDSSRLLRACSTAIAPGMIINTNTKKVLESRKYTLELLLSDHSGDCRPPCVRACPAGSDCQGYVGLIANGEFQAAYELIMESTPLPASMGRVCPHPCEAQCRRKNVEDPIAIMELKRYAADYVLKNISEAGQLQPSGNRLSIIPEMDNSGDVSKNNGNGKNVTIIGGGPGGLSAAYFLRKMGHNVAVYDANPKMGGMLRYGIPEYRLPKEVLSAEIEQIRAIGVKLINNIKIGRDISFDYIRKNSDAVIVAIGCQTSVKLGCTGEDLPGVMGGVDFLGETARGESRSIIKNVAVVGGGNTAMDACRTAVRFGAEAVYNIYRRTREEMPAEQSEISEAFEEGVIFKHLCNPVEIISQNGRAAGVRLQKMELGEPGADGRRTPVPIPGSEEIIYADLIIMAIGQGVDYSGFEDLQLTRRKTIRADENTYETNLKGVFAIGDATNKGAGIAVEAIGEAKRAANVVNSYLNGEITAYDTPFIVTQEDSDINYSNIQYESRVEMPQLTLAHRKSSFAEYNIGFSQERAVKEAMRCLECGCSDYFECKLLKYSRDLKAEPQKFAGEKRSQGIDDSNPLLSINHDKCILCGQCVRVCNEVMNQTALGLTERGFKTAVNPAMKLPLAQTNCISCGQCAAICPTGAFSEKLSVRKAVPVAEKLTDTTCSYCSLGCRTMVASNAGLILRCIPSTDDSLLCVKGRYALGYLQNMTRITSPFIKKNGKQFVATYINAYTEITKNLQRIAGVYGPDAIAVSVSDKLTNEDIYLIKQYTDKTLETQNVFSVNNNESGLYSVLGHNSSTNSMDELEQTDVILLIAPDIVRSHTIADVRIKRAVKNGAKLILITDKAQADEGAHINIDLNVGASAFGEAASFDTMAESSLAEFTKLLYGIKAGQNGIIKKDEAGSLRDYLNEKSRGAYNDPSLAEAAALYNNAKSAMIIYDVSSLSPASETLIADIALITGHIGKPRSGIIALKRNNNSQGLADMGIKLGGGKLAESVSCGKIKALLVFGEDIPFIDLEKLEFLMVSDCVITNTAAKADILLPLTAPTETTGTYTNTERKILEVKASLSSPFEKTNLDIICGLANNTQKKLFYSGYDEVFADIKQNIPGYENAAPGTFTYGKPVLCHLAGLMPRIPDNNLNYYKQENTNAAYRKFVDSIEKGNAQSKCIN